ncbi:hypothetical protein KIH39_06320 [Telmatocola sphagniphila]|uniref:Uncharacterized protein n=1 Tax=Telmatocola sphagniphila TaxID=1123043 RepID=A0A8E6EZJ0_9BACT|nr:hypothetical protein [Telmatocola sphagniphila]QVL33521.1 hypothetical protein KIH39_06320 [Telmatocola sphagniphila]
MNQPSLEKIKIGRWIFVLLSVAGLCLVSYLVAPLVKKYNPYFIYRPDVQDARKLLEVARSRALGESEFDEVLAILKTGDDYSKIMALSIVELQVEREPKVKLKALSALEEVKRTEGGRVAESTKIVLERLNGRETAK